MAQCHDLNCASRSILTLDNIGFVTVAPDGADTSLKLDSEGLPVISYYHGSNGDLNLARFQLDSPSDVIERVIADLEAEIETNPGSQDKLEDVIAKLETALEELNKSPADNQAALGNLEAAVGDLQSAVDDELIDPILGTSLMDDLAGAARSLAEEAIETAEEQMGNQNDIDDALDLLAEGDALRASGEFKDAVTKYKDAVAKAESAF